MMSASGRLAACISLMAILGTAGCRGGKINRVYAVYTGGDAHRGARVIDKFRCGACHMIPGIHNADGLVGPPLIYFGRRTLIAGEVPNNPDNLVQWILSPQSIEPHTGMPTLGLNEQEARDAAAYLYTLR